MSGKKQDEVQAEAQTALGELRRTMEQFKAVVAQYERLQGGQEGGDETPAGPDSPPDKG